MRSRRVGILAATITVAVAWGTVLPAAAGAAASAPALAPVFGVTAQMAATAPAAVAATPGEVEAQATGDYKLTLVARYCPDSPGNAYLNVRANRARNNIMQTLKDLGPPSNYNNSMNPPVNPTNEEAAPQSVCQPMPAGFPVTVGRTPSGFAPLPVNGSNQPYLGKVTSPNTQRVLASTPLLNDQGQTTGQNIAGAVTYDLTDADYAATANQSFWVMGGSAANGLGDLTGDFAPDNLQFAALRCNIDALNGDNVEWVRYRTGQTHAFCYAIYIQDDVPLPTPGTITIRKAAQDSGGISFGFEGDISFNPGGTFSLQDQGVFSETRAPGDWYVTEDALPDGWELTGITCDADDNSSFFVDLGLRRVNIRLAEGGFIDCTYTNQPIPPPAKLVVEKATYGATGAFPFTITPPTEPVETPTLTTTSDQGEDPASYEIVPTESGTYEIAEELPDSPNGTWELTDVSCVDDAGDDVPTTGTGLSREVAIAPSREVRCTFINTFTPRATVVIRAATVGGSNAAINYTTLVTNADGECDFRTDPPFIYSQDADTVGQGDSFVTATGDSMADQPIQTYCIAGTRPTEGADPSWVTKSVECTGDIDYGAPFATSAESINAIVQPLPGGTVTCDFLYLKRAELEVRKTVDSGNDLRDGPVTLTVNCVNSAAADPDAWPKTLSLATSGTQLSESFYLEGGDDPLGEDSCTVTETADGAPPVPATAILTPLFDGSPWTSQEQVKVGSSTPISGTASNGKPVSIGMKSGACTYSSGKVTAPKKGTCEVRFSATGNTVVTPTTTWSVTPGGNAGSGATTGAFDVPAGTTPVAAFVDSYSAQTPTMTEDRRLRAVADPVPPRPECAAVTAKPKYKKIKVGKTTVLVKRIKVDKDCKETTVSVKCLPKALGKGKSNKYCAIKISKNKVKVAPRCNDDVLVRVRIVAKPKKGKRGEVAKTVYTRTWKVKSTPRKVCGANG